MGFKMKRTRTLLADDGGTKVSVVIKIDNDDSLTRGEVNSMSSRLADGMITLLGNTRNLEVYMSDIRVK
jgi:hypothetical protein